MIRNTWNDVVCRLPGGTGPPKAKAVPSSDLCKGPFKLRFKPMAQGLQLSQRLTQSLVLAPQLQQSLALLQAPTLELKALVEQELQQNPVLEESATTETDQADKEGADAERAEA